MHVINILLFIEKSIFDYITYFHTIIVQQAFYAIVIILIPSIEY